MPALFDRLGISFQYPENWRLDEADILEGRKSVTVYSPSGGAFWMVSVHPRGSQPAKLAADALHAMTQEYEEVESKPVSETLSEFDLVGYDLNFYYLDLTNSAVVRCVRTEHGTLTIFYQGEDREYDAIEPVFRAMTVSLLRNAVGKGS